MSDTLDSLMQAYAQRPSVILATKAEACPLCANPHCDGAHSDGDCCQERTTSARCGCPHG